MARLDPPNVSGRRQRILDSHDVGRRTLISRAVDGDEGDSDSGNRSERTAGHQYTTLPMDGRAATTRSALRNGTSLIHAGLGLA